MKKYIIVKEIEAENLKEAFEKEAEAKLIEVSLKGEETGDKQMGFNG